ncbi:MAG TPA: hypothetical protein VFJ52_04670 [Terriglobia bacterium]|nr:hypothetical protein [Terriglobia bacterium]
MGGGGFGETGVFSCYDRILIQGTLPGLLRAHPGGKTSGQVSRLLKRPRLHGLIKKAGYAYRYYLTLLGRPVIASGLKLKNPALIPELAAAPRTEQNFLPDLAKIGFHRHEGPSYFNTTGLGPPLIWTAVALCRQVAG